MVAFENLRSKAPDVWFPLFTRFLMCRRRDSARRDVGCGGMVAVGEVLRSYQETLCIGRLRWAIPIACAYVVC